MPREQSVAILDPLRRLINRQSGSTLTDAQLLENFVVRRDEASFEVLVWRHGAMVLALCKRVLRDSHEAEDAFQATFLVFAKKAGSIGRGEVLAAWLYKVAYRIALRLRAAAARRSPTGEPTDELPAPEAVGDADWHDLKPVLDDEIARLPEKYRAPFVLCYLEGRTNEEAAAQLGCPKGTVLSRLARGRDRLRARLARRGVALTATAFALTLSQNAASAALPVALVTPTVGAAVPFAAGMVAVELVPAHIAALTEGALKTMTLVKMKVASAVLALAVLGTGITWGARADDSRLAASSAAVALVELNPEPNVAPAEEDRERPNAGPTLVGKVIEVAKGGKSFTVETPPTERGGASGKTVVKFAEKAEVTYNGVGAGGATLVEGYTAQVWFAENSKEIAVSVVFNAVETGRRGGDLVGQVSAIAKDGKSMTLTMRPNRGERAVEVKETVTLDDKTVLAFSNVARGEAKLTVGQFAVVWYSDDGKTAGKVQLAGTGEAREREEKRPDIVGQVFRAAPDAKSFVVEVPPTERGAEPKRLVFKTDDKSTVTFHNVPVDGAKLAPGFHAQLWLVEGSKVDVAKVRFTGTVPDRWATVNGKVVAVAKDGKSFTVETPPAVRGEEGKRAEIKVTAATRLTFFNVGPDEAKLAEGLTVQVRLLDGPADTASRVTLTRPTTRR